MMVFFQLDSETAFDEKSRTKLRLTLVQIEVALDELNGGEIFWTNASSNIAVYVIEMTKHEVNGKLVILWPGSSQLFSKNDLIMKYEVDKSSMN